MLVLDTPHLELTPCPLDFARVVTVDKPRAERFLKARVPQEWLEDDLQDYLPLYVQHLEQEPDMLTWGIWLMIRAQDRVLVGDIGFKGKPDTSGTIDIGYKVLTPYRRRGYAYEAARALVDWAFAQPAVRRITAQSLTDNAGSIRVLEKLGMQRTKTEGGYIHWELKAP